MEIEGMDMENDYGTLKRFVRNFFEKERYLEPENAPLAAGEIEDLSRGPKRFQGDRRLMDRLLDDPEAVEMIADARKTDSKREASKKSGKVISFEEIRRRYPKAKRLQTVGGNDLRKVAASADVGGLEGKEAIQVQDEALQGFLQIIEYKQRQYMVSGHFRLFASGSSIRLVLPDGQVIDEFDEEDGMLKFRTVVKEKFDLSGICYELY
ncbi:MAG: hypothetical protein GY866_17915 [Proteobacteria bacterium]|nr:hypothetical protein [Pseudomonadota bacterium]